MARRTLNISAIKQVIVLLTAIATALLCTVTGYGVHIAYIPALAWMLGYGQEKAKALAYRLSIFSIVSALVAVGLRSPSILKVVPLGFLLFLGAVFGAVFAKPLSKKTASPNLKRLFQSVGMLLMVGVMVQVTKQSAFAPDFAAIGSPPIASVLIGLTVGIASQLTGIGSSLLTIPALYYFGGQRPLEAIVVTLCSILFASLPVALGYAKRGLYDGTYAPPALIGGVLGSGLGAWLLVTLSQRDPKVVLLIFAVISMFWCARELALANTPSTPISPQPKIEL